MAMYGFVWLYIHVCMYECMAMSVWLCVYGDVCIAMYGWLYMNLWLYMYDNICIIA